MVARPRSAQYLPDEDYLEVDTGQIVVAMAALLAAALGAPTEHDAYLAALIADGSLPTDASTRQLAVAALTRIAGDDSEWHELWADAGELTAVLAVNERLAEVLTAAEGRSARQPRDRCRPGGRSAASVGSCRGGPVRAAKCSRALA